MRQTTRRIPLFFCFTFSLAVLSNIVAAQTFTVLHTFTGGPDGGSPYAGVTIAHPGLIYGTSSGSNNNLGVVFALLNSGSGWTLNQLHQFGGPSDGASPFAGVVIGPNGILYGTTEMGGSAGGGTVFEAQTPPHACHAALCSWKESVLHSFQGGTNDGEQPEFGNLIFDQSGNIYGTTAEGGASNLGTVFELTPSGSGWTVNVLHSFSGSDGELPLGGLVFDPAGNLYGTTAYGGSNGYGTVFELSPSAGGRWTETVIHNFYIYTDGATPSGTLLRDASGNLYGTTYEGGESGEGNVFELSYSNGAWFFSPLGAPTNCAAVAGVVMDSAGNVYGTCVAYENNGSVFKGTNSEGSWTFTNLHVFTGGADGAQPWGSVALDSSGNLYGTTFQGGDLGCNDGLGCGTVWEITP